MVDPDNVDLSSRALGVVEFWAKFAGGAAIVWGFVVKIVKPLMDWRRKRMSDMIRAALKPELDLLQGNSTQMQEIAEDVSRMAQRQEEVYMEIDSLLEIAQDNRDRHDETADLLNAMGLSSDRRLADRRQRVEELFEGLNDRRKERRRRDDVS